MNNEVLIESNFTTADFGVEQQQLQSRDSYHRNINSAN